MTHKILMFRGRPINIVTGIRGGERSQNFFEGNVDSVVLEIYCFTTFRMLLMQSLLGELFEMFRFEFLIID